MRSVVQAQPRGGYSLVSRGVFCTFADERAAVQVAISDVDEQLRSASGVELNRLKAERVALARRLSQLCAGDL